LLPGVLGLVAGALLFGITYQTIFPPIVKQANLGNVTILSLWNLNPFLVIAVFTVATLLLFYFLEHGWNRKDKLED
jgi:hypothetical protein